MATRMFLSSASESLVSSAPKTGTMSRQDGKERRVWSAHNAIAFSACAKDLSHAPAAIARRVESRAIVLPKALDPATEKNSAALSGPMVHSPGTENTVKTPFNFCIIASSESPLRGIASIIAVLCTKYRTNRSL